MQTFPSNPEEYEEYREFVNGGGNGVFQDEDGDDRDMGDEDDIDPDWEQLNYEGDEDRYLDSHWEDQSEYGMEGCCGDF